MTARGWYVAGLFILLTCAAPVRGQSIETWVDQEFTDCALNPGYSTASAPLISTSAVPGVHDIDLGGETVAAEDADGDPTYSSIRTAVGGTTAGGIVHVTVPGIYRHDETISIDNDITIRGPRDQDVILEGICAGAATDAITISGGATVVVLENLTIRGHAGNAITMSGCDQCVLILVNCRIEGNAGFGIQASGSTVIAKDTEFVMNGEAAIYTSGGSVELSDSTLIRNGVGIGYCNGNSIDMNGSEITRSAAHGIGELGCTSSNNPIELTMSHSRIVRNDGHGIELDATTGTNVSIHSVLITNSLIANNRGHGLRVDAGGGTATSVIVSGSQIMANVGDALDLFAAATSPALSMSVFKNEIVRNGAGLRNSGNVAPAAVAGQSWSTCLNNLIGANAGGNFIGWGTPPCGNAPAGIAVDHEATF